MWEFNEIPLSTLMKHMQLKDDCRIFLEGTTILNTKLFENLLELKYGNQTNLNIHANSYHHTFDSEEKAIERCENILPLWKEFLRKVRIFIQK